MSCVKMQVQIDCSLWLASAEWLLFQMLAKFLVGKSKPYYVRNLDCGDYVVVINASGVKVTGKKETDKKYYRHSGYPGGLRTQTLKELRESKPEELIRHAVKGMLPQNKLRDRMLTRLFVYRDENHSYSDKIKNQSVRKAQDEKSNSKSTD